VTDSLRIIPLGGLGEVGKNMTVFELGDERIVVDAGLAFPRDEHFGVDLVLPDFSYLVGRPVRAIVLTHAHEDHVGGLPYVLREVDVDEVIGTRLTLALVKSKLDEHGLAAVTALTEAEPGSAPIELGPFRIEFIRMAHSIPDAAAVVIETSAGRVLHTGDWKLDHTPVDGLKTDVGALAALGNLGVDLLLGDSTNAERPGMTGSERLVGEAFRQLIPLRTGRIVVASFASNIHRVQQAAEVAIANGRKVAVVGRSMRKNMNISRSLGYVDLPDEMIVSPKEAMDLPPGEVLILCTGSQGEPMSALSRIAQRNHSFVHITPGDTVILASSLIPGNENAVFKVINGLIRLGANVVHKGNANVHVSGHASAGELLYAYNIVKPRNVLPVHGEYRHMKANAELARSTGVENVVIAEDGVVVDLVDGVASIAGKVDCGYVFVDGSNIGDITESDLKDRRILGEEGFISVIVVVDSVTGKVSSGPEIHARGFAEDDSTFDEIKKPICEALDRAVAEGNTDSYQLQQTVRRVVGRWVSNTHRRRPMIIPVVIEA